MGLSLNNIYQRPYVNQDTRNRVKKRENEEQTTSANAQRQESTNQNSKSKGLQYSNQERKQSYTPNYAQSFAASAYSNVSINTPKAQKNNEQATSYIQNPQENHTDFDKTQINIAQILKDFRNTAIAIGTPKNISEEVDGYVNLIEMQVTKDNPNVKLIKSNLKNAASLLDAHISETLNKDSKVVENWVDTLFLQKINFKYDEEDINERFLVKFPDGTTSKTKRQEELRETSQEQEPVTQDSAKVIPITVAGDSAIKIPQDKQLKSLFIQAKKYAYAQNPEKAIKMFEQALNRANELDDTETSGKIYFEVAKIYDNHDYLPQALKSYHQSIKLTKDENVKAKAYYSMAQIYDDVNQVSPALNHYASAVSHAGEAENLPAQTASLTKMGNIYSDMYEKEAFNYYDLAQEIANETENYNLQGFVSSNTGKAYLKFDEPEKALKSFSKAVLDYTNAQTPLKTAQNYEAAADVMVEFNNLDKAHKLLTKAQKFARKTDNLEYMNVLNNKINQLEELDVK